MNKTTDRIGSPDTRHIHLVEQRSFQLGGNYYRLGPAVTTDLPAALADQLCGPFILVHDETRSLGLRETFTRWSETDDVYTNDPQWRTLIVGSHINRQVDDQLDDAWFWHLRQADSRPQEGPYYILHGQLFPVWRLYTDTEEAFVLATHPQSDPHASFTPLRQVDDQERRMVAVPSRIPSFRKDALPLSGLRVSVKDNIDLKGVRTWLSSKAWQRHYPPKQETSPLIVSLMAAGAVIVGKTKLSQFGVLEFPTAEWVDVHAPSNPRGDGNLSPGASTSGGACANAAYDWLDVSIGTDTAGSIRKPAANNGLFALRLTTPKIPMAGIFPLAPVLDAPGFLARDINTLIKVVKAVLPFGEVYQSLRPTHIHVLESTSHKIEENTDDERNIPGEAASKSTSKFMQDLTTHTRIEAHATDLHAMYYPDLDAERDRMQNIYNANQTPTHDDPIQQIIEEEAVEKIKHYKLFQSLKDFDRMYRQAHGENPYYNPVIKHVLKSGRRTSGAKYQKCVRLKNDFQSWFRAETRDSIIVYQLGPPLEFRDDPSPPLQEDSADAFIPNSFISPLAGCPEVVVPIDQVPYHSDTTCNEELVPLVVSIIGPAGGDVALLEFVKDFLEASKRPTSVKAGRLAFDEIPGVERISSFEGWEVGGSFMNHELGTSQHASSDDGLGTLNDEQLPCLTNLPTSDLPETEDEEVDKDASSRPSLDDRSLVILSDVETEDGGVLTDDASSVDESFATGIVDDSGFAEASSPARGIEQCDHEEGKESPTCCSCFPFGVRR